MQIQSQQNQTSFGSQMIFKFRGIIKDFEGSIKRKAALLNNVEWVGFPQKGVGVIQINPIIKGEDKTNLFLNLASTLTETMKRTGMDIDVTLSTENIYNKPSMFEKFQKLIGFS